MPRTATQTTTDQRPLTVAELTSQVKDLLEGAFPAVWVAGEISNFSRPQSGHCYFTLKDESAQVRAVLWRGSAARLRFDMVDGLEVICQGHLDVYPPRGSYQLVVDQVEPKGVGALELALRKLRAKLAAEGLFDAARKKPLPVFPRRIAFVTSPTGAALRDFLEVLRRRWSGTDVLVAPTRVQGDGAAEEIAAAIRAVDKIRPAVDVMVVGRGGGSMEDLWAFNEEPVVRAIAAARVPVISAVGHEIDVTLSDLVADVRALTPSEAAELAVPSATDVGAKLQNQRSRLDLAVRQKVSQSRTRIETISHVRSIRRPFERVHESGRRLDELASRAGRSINQSQSAARAALGTLAGKLETLSPLAVLNRGYSLTQRADGQLIRDASELAAGDEIMTRFTEGQAVSTVERIIPGES